MGKQVLEKCLMYEPQSEQQSVDFATVYSHSIISRIAVSLRRYVGKLNRPKMSRQSHRRNEEKRRYLVLGVVETQIG